MKKLAIFIRGGIGDRFSFFATVPDILQRFNLTIDELLVIQNNNLWHNDPNLPEYLTNEVLLKMRQIKNTVMAPSADRSKLPPYTPHENEHGVFSPHPISDPTFLPWRGPKQKQFVLDEMKKYGIKHLIDFPFVEQILYWDGEKNIKLTDLKRPPFHFETKKEFSLWDTENTVLIHCSPLRYRDLPIWDNSEMYTDTVNLLPELNFVIIGLKNSKVIFNKKNTIDFRGKLNPQQIFDGVLYTKKALMTGSNFAFHRLTSGKDSIFIWPHRYANPKTIFSKIYFDTTKMIFLNSHAELTVNDIVKNFK